MSNKLVSILITCYNSESKIANVLESLINQTYKNIQIVIIDDGSTDSTKEIITNYQSKDSRINLFVQGKIGRGKALNYGIKKCNGYYVAINDADDYSKPERIEKQVQFLEKNPEVGLLGGRKEIIENGKIIDSPVITDDYALRVAFTKGQPIQHSAVMFPKNILEKVGGYNENINFLFDRDIFLRIGKISKMAQLEDVIITLNRSSNQFFMHKYKGMSRVWMSTKYQLKAVIDFNFPKYWLIGICAKLFYATLLNYKRKLTF